MRRELRWWDFSYIPIPRTMTHKTRIAVVGAGAFGQNHCRVVRESDRAELSAIVDLDPSRGTLTDFRRLPDKVDGAIAAVPTTPHQEIATFLLDAGIDVLVA